MQNKNNWIQLQGLFIHSYSYYYLKIKRQYSRILLDI